MRLHHFVSFTPSICFLFCISVSTLGCLPSVLCAWDQDFFFMALQVLERHCWLVWLPRNVGSTLSALRDLSYWASTLEPVNKQWETCLQGTSTCNWFFSKRPGKTSIMRCSVLLYPPPHNIMKTIIIAIRTTTTTLLPNVGAVNCNYSTKVPLFLPIKYSLQITTDCSMIGIIS